MRIVEPEPLSVPSARPRLRSLPAHPTGFLPSLLTVGNMVLGFYSILMTVQGRFYGAALAIVYAHALDILDGRVARWARAQSRLGIQFDSLSDWISFGIAPAILMYQITASPAVPRPAGLWPFLTGFAFVLAGAWRLARFNIGAEEDIRKIRPESQFIGMPIPAAGGLIASAVLVHAVATGSHAARQVPGLVELGPWLVRNLPETAGFLAVLMASRLPFPSFKQVELLRPKSLLAKTLTVIIVGGLILAPQCTALWVYSTFLVWSLARLVWQGPLRAGRRRLKEPKPA